MAEVKWIKIVTDIFNNKKIKQIDAMPDADTILVIWFKLLCLAGNINESGLIILTKDLAYTDEMLATEFRKPINTVRLALKMFENFGMIELVDNIYCISNWEKYQNIEGLEKIREQTKIRVARHRKNQKLLPCNVTVTQGNATEVELELDKEKNIEVLHTSLSTEVDSVDKIPYQDIVNLYHSICTSYPKLKTISNNRKKAISARWKQYKKDITVFATLFQRAEQSEFLKGANGRDWQADFNWLLNDANMAKVLEGKYDKKLVQATISHKETTYERAKREADEMLRKEGIVLE